MNRLLILLLTFGLMMLTACKEDKENTQSKSTRAEKAVSSEKSETEKPVKKTKSPKKTMSNDQMKLTPPTIDEVGDPNEVAVIETEVGKIVVEFYPDVAPLHVANFKKLAKAGFYDGTTFHRVLPGFVIQGGCPNSKNDNPNDDGTGGPPYRVKAEFNDRLHKKGILSMARSGDPNSAGSQFFICLGDVPHLDNKYTVFGKVIKGIETVDKIAELRRDPSKSQDRKLPAFVMKKVYVAKKSDI